MVTTAGLATLLAACGGGSHGIGTLPATPGTSANGGTGNVSFVIKIPAATSTSSSVRSPLYVSPATQAIAVTVDPGTPQAQTQGQNLTTGAPGCSTTNGALACTVALSVMAGAHTFNVATYDETLTSGGTPQGNALSQVAGFPFTVLPASANAIAVTLQGVPTSIAIAPQASGSALVPTQDVTGTQATGFQFVGAYKADGTTPYARTFTVVTKDADGNEILGAGAPAITVTSGNSAVVSNGVASTTTPNVFTVTTSAYSASSTTANLTITATPGAGSGLATPVTTSAAVTIAARNAPRIYVLDQNTANGNVWAFDESGTAIPAASAVLGGIAAAGAFDAVNGELYVANGYAYFNALNTLTNTVGPPIASPGAWYDNFTLDAANRELVLMERNGAPTFMTEGGTVAATPGGSWYETQSGAFPAAPTGTVYDPRNSRFYVLDYTNDVLQAYNAAGMPVGAVAVGNAPYGLAQDPSSGNLIVQTDANGYTIYSEALTPVAAPGGFPGAGNGGPAVDPVNGVVYDPSSAGMKAYDLQGNPVSLPAGAFPNAPGSWNPAIYVP